MLRKKALATAAAAVLVGATGLVAVAALSGAHVFGFNQPQQSAVFQPKDPDSVLVITKKKVVKSQPRPAVTAALAPTVATTVPLPAAPVAPDIQAVPLKATVDSPAPKAAATPSTTSAPPVSVSPNATPVLPVAATTPTTAATAPLRPTTTTTTIASASEPEPAATAAPVVTPAPTTTSTTAAPVATTATSTQAQRPRVTASGQPIPSSWQLPSSWPAGQPYPSYPPSCNDGQLEDNGKWNCQ